MNVASTDGVSSRTRYNGSVQKSSSATESAHLNDSTLKPIVNKIVHIANTNTPSVAKGTSSSPPKLLLIAAEAFLQPKAKHDISDADLWDMAAKVKEAAISPKLKHMLPHVAAIIMHESIIITGFEKAKKRVQQGEHYKVVAHESGIHTGRQDITDEMVRSIVTLRMFRSEPVKQRSPENIKPPPSILKNINVDTNDSARYRALFEIHKERAINARPDDSHTNKPLSVPDCFLASLSSRFDDKCRRMKLGLDLELEFLSD